MQTAHLITHFDNEILRDILLIIRDSFPAGWQYDDAEEYYREMLSNTRNIHIILVDSGERVGYLHSIPHNDAVKELEYDDPAMKNDDMMYYIETVAILPDHRGGKGFSKMLQLLITELKLRGIKKLALHARVVNSLSENIRAKFGTAAIRRIEKWRYYNFEEPTDYYEVPL